MSPAGKAATPVPLEVPDSAGTVSAREVAPTKPSGKGGKGGGKGPPSSKGKTESTPSKSTPGFAEGNAVLANYGLSLSGYRERILSPFKTEKFFHLISESYQRLLTVKPSAVERFTYEEFLHCSALQVYQRIENVKFDALGVKPSAPLRIPLPRNLRVFQPIWSVLANIGTVLDDELRVQYIPDAVLPDSKDLDSDHDIEGLLSCTLYDWDASWRCVQAARETRDSFAARDGYVTTLDSNESVPLSKDELIKRIAHARRARAQVQLALDEDIAQDINGVVYLYPLANMDEVRLSGKEGGRPLSDFKTVGGKVYDIGIPDSQLVKSTSAKTPGDYSTEIDSLMDQARASKRERITPRFDIAYQSESYRISDGTVSSDPGAYGSRLHWDPQLWLDYENFVNEVAPLAMFSLSMPIETTGSYAWLLPVEKRRDTDSAVCVKLPKASVPTQTWMLAMLLQSSTLPQHRRSTWYSETDYLTNLTGLRLRYIQAAIKTPSPVEQFGTY